MRKLSFLPILILLIASCGDEAPKKTEQKNWFDAETDYSFQSKAVNLISNEENIMAYGSIKMNQILKKGLFDSEMAKSSVVKLGIKELNTINEALDMNTPIYYALQKGDSPEESNVLLFGKVKDQNKMIENLEEQIPYANREESDNYSIFYDEEMIMGIGKEQFVIKISPMLQLDIRTPKDDIVKLMSSLNSETSNPSVASIFSESKDMTMAFDYKELMTMVQAASPTNYYNNMNDMVLDLYDQVAMDLSFEEGAIKMLYHWNYKKGMDEFDFFKPESKDVVAQLGTGSPVMAFAANIDVENIEKFRKKYYPESISNQLESMELEESIKEMIPDELAVIEALIMKEGIKSFIDGRFGAALFMNDGEELGTPDFNFMAGIGPNMADMIKEGIKEFPEMSMFVDMMNQFTLNDQILLGYSSEEYAPKGTNILKTEKFKNFGNKPISLFIDFSKIPKEGLLKGIDRSLADYEPLLDMVDAITMEFDMTEGNITIHTKDANKNALTYIMDRLSDMISNTSLLLNAI
jgi:hypothetical protein